MSKVIPNHLDTDPNARVIAHLLRVDISSCSLSGTPTQRAEHPSEADFLASSIAPILRRGLSDRAKLVHVSAASDSSLTVGIIYDPSNATRLLDIGPSADKTAECECYRQLWGDRAELRRFKDGSISESVVWDVSRPEDAAFIPGRIVRWLLSRHLGVDDDAVVSLSSNPSWLSITQVPPSARDAVCVQGSEKLGFRPIMTAYDELYRLLKSIDDDLPLAILHVTPADEILRYASTFVPHPIDADRWPTAPDCLKHLPKAEIVLQFESSPRWPDDLAAIQKVKLALIEKIARIIMQRLPRSRAGLALDANASQIEDRAALEIFLPQGVAFHVRIFNERERTLLERIIEDDAPVFGTSLPRPPRRLALPALDHHIHRFVHRPQHHSAMAPLHHRYPSFSSATRLLKRWFAAHMLSLQIRPETIELLMARAYLDPGPLHVPASATAGFVRAVEHLATWDWKETAAFVPIFSATRDAASQSGRIRFPSDKRKDAHAAFELRRAKEKEIVHGPWVVVTEEDTQGLRWTGGVGKVVAGRVTSLARATLGTITSMAANGGINVVVSLPPLLPSGSVPLSQAEITDQCSPSSKRPPRITTPLSISSLRCCLERRRRLSPRRSCGRASSDTGTSPTQASLGERSEWRSTRLRVLRGISRCVQPHPLPAAKRRLTWVATLWRRRPRLLRCSRGRPHRSRLEPREERAESAEAFPRVQHQARRFRGEPARIVYDTEGQMLMS
jgi:U3 small nucleolar RNA-associated protein 22